MLLRNLLGRRDRNLAYIAEACPEEMNLSDNFKCNIWSAYLLLSYSEPSASATHEIDDKKAQLTLTNPRDAKACRKST